MSGTTVNKLETRIGLIGLGLMGSRLARRLHANGWNLRAWNRSPQPADRLREQGVDIASSLADLVDSSDVVLSSLANDAAVRDVYLEEGGVFSAIEPGTIVLEMSTISPNLSLLLHEEAGNKAVNLLDLAISGSTPAVDAGTITLLAGGGKDTFDQCAPLFESLAKQWFLIGPGSSGIRMKLVVNLLLGIAMEGLAEAVSLGEHLQIDRPVLLDVLSRTTVIAPAVVGKISKIRDGNYAPEFPLRLMSKDLDLVMKAARAAGADLPAASIARAVLGSDVAANGDLDMAAVAPLVIGPGTQADV
jgi:3-hydroxyisobutyrate dehydrogenase